MAKKKKKASLDDSSVNSFSPQDLSEDVAVAKSGNAKHKGNADTPEKKNGGTSRKSNIEKSSIGKPSATGKKASYTAGAKKTTTETKAVKKKIAENTDGDLSKPKLQTDENTAPKETENNTAVIDSPPSEKPSGARRKKKKAKEITVEMPDEAPRFEIFDVEDSASLEEEAIAALPHAEVEPELLNYDPDEIEDTHESPEDAEKYERFLEDYKAVMAEMLKAAKQSPREREESSEIDDEDDISDFIVTDETTHEDREDDELIDEDFLISAEAAFEEKAEKIEADEAKYDSEEVEAIEEAEVFEEAKDTEEPVIIEEAEVVDEPEIVEEADIADEAKVIEEAEIADEAKAIKETEIADEAEVIEEAEIADEAETIPSDKRDRSIDNIYAEDIIIENSEEQEILSEAEEETIPVADEDQDGNEDIQLSMDIQEPEPAKRDAEDDYEDEPEEKKYDPEHPRRIDSLFETVELCVFALAIVMVLITFFFRYSIVDGSSMNGTLHDGDFLIISEFLYEPERGDIVVFEYEDKETGVRKPLVKRVIGIEGDTVEITPDGSVILNGDAIDESEYLYIDYGYYPNAKVWTVGEGEIFVLGDHRNNSNDSEDFGPVSSDTVIGKALFRFFPFESFGAIE